ncbi:MAG: insulinase family protein [Desulfobacterales bacterium]|nr:insulinase family protein [Desulfobacterales bacterium]
MNIRYGADSFDIMLVSVCKLSIQVFVIFFFMCFYSCSMQSTHDKKNISNDHVMDLQFKPDPDLVYGQLDNGFRYVIYQNKEPKNRVSMHLVVKAGSLDESEGQEGLAHFLEHMLFNGTTNFPPGELVKFFQEIGMQFGPDANAYTAFNQTVYDILLPNGNSNMFKKGLLVFSDYASGALIKLDEVNKERSIILAEKRTRDSADYRTYEATLQFELPDSLVAKRLPIGLEKTIQEVTSEELRFFYDTWYRPDLLAVVVVGDIDVALARHSIEEQFSSLSARAPKKTPPEIRWNFHQGVNPFYHYEPETGSTTVTVEVMQWVTDTPDSFLFQKQMLLRETADQLVQYRLNAKIGKDDTPFTEASISSGIHLQHIAYSDITAMCQPNQWEKTLSIIEQEIRKALQYGFTPSEIERIKKEQLAKLENNVKSAATRNSQHISRQIIASLVTDRVFLSPKQKQELFVPVIEAMTTTDLHQALLEHWPSDHRLVIVTGNAAIQGNTKEEINQRILQTYNQSQTVAISSPIEKKTVQFPYLPKPDTPGEIIKSTTLDDIGVEQIDFENLVRLNIKSTPFKKDEVLVSLMFGKGKQCEPESQPGLALLTERVINESGFGSLEKDDLERALAGREATVSFFVNEDHFRVAGRCISKELELMFQLLYTYFHDIAFREDAYHLCLKRYEQEFQSLANTVEGVSDIEGDRFLANNDSRFGLADPKQMNTLSIDHMKSWIMPYIQQAMLEISVVGDVDSQKVKELAALYFGTLPKRTSNLTPCVQRPNPTFPHAQHKQFHVPSQIPKAILEIAYPTDDFWNIQRTRRLSVLAQIVSEKLRETVREKEGASYSQYAYNLSSRAYAGYGIFHIVVHAYPDQVDALIPQVQQLANDIYDKGIDDTQLKLAIEPILTSIRDMQRTNQYWLMNVLERSNNYPQQLEWSRTMMKDFASISRDEISMLAKTYLKPKKNCTMVITPKK